MKIIIELDTKDHDVGEPHRIQELLRSPLTLVALCRAIWASEDGAAILRNSGGLQVGSIRREDS